MCKLRDTDMPNNASITLPKPLTKNEEAEMAVRSDHYMNTFKDRVQASYFKQHVSCPKTFFCLALNDFLIFWIGNFDFLDRKF